MSQISFNTRFTARRSHCNNFLCLEVYKNNISYFNPLVSMAGSFNEVVGNSKALAIFKSNLVKFYTNLKNIIYES